MRVQRSALVTGVGAGNRKVEVKVSYSPQEFAVVEAEAARQGWSVGGWVGAMTEYVERLAAPPEGGGLEAVEWGRIAERAGSIEAAARSLTRRGEPSSPVDMELAARRVRRLCSARAVAGRDEAAQANARAAEFAELLVVQMDESFRAAGGIARRRVRVLLSEPTAAVLRSGAPPHAGMTVSQWVGCLAAAAAGWLASDPDNRSPLEQWLQRLSAVRTMLLTTLEQGDVLDAVASWAGAELVAAERSLGELAGESRVTRHRVSTEVVLDLLGWQPGQMRLALTYPAATMGVR